MVKKTIMVGSNSEYDRCLNFVTIYLKNVYSVALVIRLFASALEKRALLATGSSEGAVRYVLATDQGTAKRMVVEAHQLETMGPVQSMQGRRVVVTADTLIGRKDTLQVCAIRLES